MKFSLKSELNWIPANSVKALDLELSYLQVNLAQNPSLGMFCPSHYQKLKKIDSIKFSFMTMLWHYSKYGFRIHSFHCLEVAAATQFREFQASLSVNPSNPKSHYTVNSTIKRSFWKVPWVRKENKAKRSQKACWWLFCGLWVAITLPRTGSGGAVSCSLFLRL